MRSRRNRLSLKRHMSRFLQIKDFRHPSSGEAHAWIFSRLQSPMSSEAALSGDASSQENARLLAEIEAKYSGKLASVSVFLLHLVIRRFFTDVRVRNVASIRKIPSTDRVVFVPCHRSTLDHFMLPYALSYHGFQPAFITAGINLNFWPIGSIMRRLGVFFVRRGSFGSNRSYAALFSAYVRFLLHKNIPLQFFHEGGRSRTGKFLSPMLGLMQMCVEFAKSQEAEKTTWIVPVHLAYDRILEEESYLEELGGKKKKGENALDFALGLKKLLRKYGSADVSFGEPLDLRQFIKDSGQKSSARIAKSVSADVQERIGKSSCVSRGGLVSLSLLNIEKLPTPSVFWDTVQVFSNFMRSLPQHGLSGVSCRNVTNTPVQKLSKELGLFHLQKGSQGVLLGTTSEERQRLWWHRGASLHLCAAPSLTASWLVLGGASGTQASLQEFVEKNCAILGVSRPFGAHSLQCLVNATLSFFNTSLEESGKSEPLCSNQEDILLFAGVLAPEVELTGKVLKFMMAYGAEHEIFSLQEFEEEMRKAFAQDHLCFGLLFPREMVRGSLSDVVSRLRVAGAVVPREEGYSVNWSVASSQKSLLDRMLL